MSEPRAPIPAGQVSTVRGRWQAPALTWVTRTVIALGLLAAVVPDPVIATPLLRVAWLVHRWRQERDRRFVGFGLGLLAVIAVGAGLAALGVGS
jgi:hypothetical protein